MKKENFMTICRSKHTSPLTPEQEAFYAGLGEAIETAFSQESVERAKQLDGLTNLIGQMEDGATVANVIRTLAGKVDELEAKTKRSFSNEERYNLKKKLEEKKDDIQRARKSGAPWEIEFQARRAASALMTTATVLTGATAINNPNMLEDMDVVVIQYPKNFILDAITSRQVSKVPAVWRWKYQDAVSDGAVAKVTEGNVKPLTDKKFKYETADRSKYAGRIEMSEELEIDFEQLVLDIISMFEDDVLRAYNKGVLDEIIAYASAYTASGLDGKIVMPTVYSAIGAMKLQAQTANYMPDVVCINPADAAEAIYLQDANGAQQFIPESLQFGGLAPFVSTGVPAGYLLIGTRSTIKEQHGALIIRKGMHGEQFIENESTIVGEIFSVLKMPTLSKASWVYAKIDDVKTLLTKVA